LTLQLSWHASTAPYAPDGTMRVAELAAATGATLGRARKRPETTMTRDIYQRCPASSHCGGWGVLVHDIVDR
jgi:hypothetical protein